MSKNYWHVKMNKLPYSGKLSHEKTFANLWKIRFSRRELSWIGCWCHKKMPLPQILQRKIPLMATKSWNSWNFSPSKVFHNAVSHRKGWLAKIAKHTARLLLLRSQSICNIIICITHTDRWESMAKPCSCMQFIKSVFYTTITWEFVSILQVTWNISTKVTQESVSGTASCVHCIWMCNEIDGSYDKIIITIDTRNNNCALVTTQTATNSWYFPV